MVKEQNYLGTQRPWIRNPTRPSKIPTNSPRLPSRQQEENEKLRKVEVVQLSPPSHGLWLIDSPPIR